MDGAMRIFNLENAVDYTTTYRIPPIDDKIYYLHHVHWRARVIVRSLRIVEPAWYSFVMLVIPFMSEKTKPHVHNSHC